MALKFPKLPSIGSADAKSRVFLIFAGLIGVIILGYIGYTFFLGGGDVAGGSSVANAPAGVQSVPGSQLSPEYYQALKQANVQSAEQAKMTGGSAVPTLMNIPGQEPSFGPSGNCTVLCSDENVDVATDINDLVRKGKLTQEEANSLIELAKNNASIDEYADRLNQLVKEGKLTPEQARKLLEDYKKQHTNMLAAESAAAMDGMIKSGQLPISVANDLLALQKKNLSVDEYAAELDRLVREGKLTPEAAAKLLAQYTQQKARENAKQNAFQLAQMAKAGEITPDVAKLLTDLQGKNVSVDDYAAQLDRLVKEGKLTPAAAAKLLEQYKKQRMGVPSPTISKLLSQGGAKAEQAKKLQLMQANNASLADYEAELKKAVAAKIITPEEASKLLEEYRNGLIPVGVAPGATETLPSTSDFAKLQAQLAQQEEVPPAPLSPVSNDFSAAQAQAAAEAAAARAERIAALETAMSGQAQQLLAAWTPPTMAHVAGSAEEGKEKIPPPPFAGGPGSGEKTGSTDKSGKTRPLIKSGTILFAVLDTTVDSDYPDTPVMVTIVSGPFKGARLLGKLALAQGKDKVSLTFSSMDMDSWATTKSVTAFAIDPDTARTVMASSADHHYLLRYGSIMGNAFLTGYSQAITQAGSTQTTGVFGTTSTFPNLSPSNKFMVGLGQVGTQLGQAMQGYFNTPVTVKVNAGVGLGILFMSDVQE